MKIVHIKNKLKELDIDIDSINMGNFDFIGEFTAKRSRKSDDINFKKYGAFYRANYERGILIYYLIRKFKLTSMLEIGFGRGYSTFCAANAFYDSGIEGKIVTIDSNFDKQHIKNLQNIFNSKWFSYISFVEGKSKDVLKDVEGNFDLVYIDGDHSYDATKSDWEMTKSRFNKIILFDDYHLPTHEENNSIKCKKAIDEIDHNKVDCNEPELIILDRRLFFDDRKFEDDKIDYGQVLMTKNNIFVDGSW